MHKINLIGDGIENVNNAMAMAHAAALFSGDYQLLNPKGIISEWTGSSAPPALTTVSALRDGHELLIALDNAPGARNLYSYRLPMNAQAALVCGNERFGISKTVLSLADVALEIPMVSRKVNCLNVAAASAVALYFLTNRFAAGIQTRSNPQKRRPEIVLLAGKDEVELGSAIRSACAFGWNRVLIEDEHQIWFGDDHSKKRQSRAAARRAKNEIRVIPTAVSAQYKFQRAVVINSAGFGKPLHQAKLAEGPAQLIVLADETEHDMTSLKQARRFAAQVEHVYIEGMRRDSDTTASAPRFRLSASIAMAEIARQVGQKAPWRPTPHEPLYESSLRSVAEKWGELVSLESLIDEY